MKILPVSDPSFQNYGQVLTGYDVSELLATLDKVTPLPEAVEYVPEQAELMAPGIQYSFRVDTSRLSPEECADAILKALF